MASRTGTRRPTGTPTGTRRPTGTPTEMGSRTAGRTIRSSGSRRLTAVLRWRPLRGRAARPPPRLVGARCSADCPVAASSSRCCICCSERSPGCWRPRRSGARAIGRPSRRASCATGISSSWRSGISTRSRHSHSSTAAAAPPPPHPARHPTCSSVDSTRSITLLLFVYELALSS